MAVDIKKANEWRCKEWVWSSNFNQPNEILYYFSENKNDITIKYKRPDGSMIGPVTFPTKNFNLAQEDEATEEAIITYVINLEKKDAAIESLEKYKVTRSADNREYKAPFFAPPCLRGISKVEKLSALEKVITWLEASKFKKPAPDLNLTLADIRALTDGDLGKRIKNIEKSDDEFKQAFATAIQNSAQSPKPR